LWKGGEILSDKDYHEGYFEGVRAALLAYLHFQEQGIWSSVANPVPPSAINNPFHKWLNNEMKEAKELRDN